MATNQAQTFMDYLTLALWDIHPILLPELPEGVTFDFKHGFLQMSKNILFSGVAHEDPMRHLRKFIKLNNTMRQNRELVEYIRLYAFPFSLNGKAWDRLCLLLENNITT